MKPSFLNVILLALITLPAFAAAPTPPATSQPAPRKFAIITLGNPRSLAIDPAGNLYVGDADGGKIQKVTPAGEVSTIGGTGASAISDPLGLGVGPGGAVYIADTSGNNVLCIPPAGSATPMPKPEQADALKSPTGVAVDAAGNAFISNNADSTILKITPAGVVSVFAGTSGSSGSADGTGPAATFTTPRGIAIDAKDNLYVVDEGNSNVRKITPAGVVTTVAGRTGETGSADGPGKSASFGAPRSLAAAADGTLYIADTDNHIIRKITAAGVVSTLAGKAGDAGNVDGPAAAARFSEPRGIAVDTAGNVYVADTGNATLRQISPTGTVTTIGATAAPTTAPKP